MYILSVCRQLLTLKIPYLKITNFEKASLLRNARAEEHSDNVSNCNMYRLDDGFSLACHGNLLI